MGRAFTRGKAEV